MGRYPVMRGRYATNYRCGRDCFTPAFNHKIKLNTFVSLIIVSIAVAIASGMDLSKVVTSVESGLGGTLGHIGLIFGFGVMLGRLLADAGGAQRIALTMLNYFGKNKLDWAVVCSAFIVGIALFFRSRFNSSGTYFIRYCP